jgi:hypothetical protein
METLFLLKNVKSHTLKKGIKKLPLSSPITDQIQLSIGIGDEESNHPAVMTGWK